LDEVPPMPAYLRDAPVPPLLIFCQGRQPLRCEDAAGKRGAGVAGAYLLG